MTPAGASASLARRLGSLLYEALLLLGVAFFAGTVFFLASGGARPEGWLLRAEQLFLAAVFASYFLYCWLRGGQTLAMKAWRIRLVGVSAANAVPRFLLAALLVPTGISILWTLVDRERQFLHDRLAGTRVIAA